MKGTDGVPTPGRVKEWLEGFEKLHEALKKALDENAGAIIPQ